MAVTYGAASTTVLAAAQNPTSITPTMPASVTAGNLLVLFVGTRSDTSAVTTPAGWTLAGTVAGGGGTFGGSTGPSRMTVFTRVATASGDAPGAVSLSSTDMAFCQVVRLANATGAWLIGAASGSDSTVGTAWSVTCDINPGLTAGDFCVVGTTNAQAASTWSGQSISATGVSAWGTATEISEFNSTTGNDINGMTFYRAVTTGTSTAAPVVTATAAGTTTNTRGVSLLLRARETTANITVTPGLASSTAQAFDPTVTVAAVPILFDFDSGTDGATVTTTTEPQATLVNGTATVYSTAAAKHGARGITAPVSTGTTDNIQVDYPAGFVGAATHSGSIYITPLNSTTTGTLRAFDIRASNNAIIATCRFHSDGKIDIAAATTRQTASTMSYSLGTAYRFDWLWNESTKLLTVNIFAGSNVEGTTPDETISGTGQALTSARWAFGPGMGNTGFNGHVDTVRFWAGTVTVEPFGSPSTTVTPDVASATAAALAPSVSTAITVIPGVPSGNIAAYLPTVSTTVTATPGVATSAPAAFDPTISTTAPGQTVTPGLASSSPAALAPTVTTTVTVTPGVATSTPAALTPSVATTVTVTPGLASSTSAAFAPDVTTTVTATPGLASSTPQAFAPSVATSVTVSPGAATSAPAALAPSVSTTVTATPGIASSSPAAFAPVVTVQGGPLTVVPDLATSTAQAFAPTVQTTVTVVPGSASSTPTTYAPTVTTSITVSPGAAVSNPAAYAPTATVAGSVDYTPHVYVTATIAPSAHTATLAPVAPATAVLEAEVIATAALSPFAPATAELQPANATAVLAGNGVGTATLLPVDETAQLVTV